MHRPAADRTGDPGAGIGRVVGPKVFFQQPPSQAIAQLARPVFALRESDQAVLAIAAEHLIESQPGLFLKLATPLLKFFAVDSRHDRSSLIGCAIGKIGQSVAAAILPRRRPATTVMHPHLYHGLTPLRSNAWRRSFFQSSNKRDGIPHETVSNPVRTMQEAKAPKS